MKTHSKANRPRLASQEGKQMDLIMLIEHYIRSGRIAGKSPQTLLWYEKRLRQFTDYLRREGHSMRAQDLHREDGEGYIDDLMNRTALYQSHPHHTPVEGGKLSPHTIHGHVRAIRALTHWASEEQYLLEDPFERLPLPKLPKKLYDILSEEEINRVIDSVNNDTVRGMRLRAMLLLFLDTGLRATELSKLKLADVDLKEGLIKVLGKGNKERYIPIGQATQQELTTYLQFYRPKPAALSVDEFFLTEDGFAFTYSGLASVMRRLRKATGLKRLHMHKLRHTAFTRMVMEGTPAFAVKQFAGHSSISTTEGYVHLAQQLTANRFRSGSVVDGLNHVKEMHRRGRKRNKDL